MELSESDTILLLSSNLHRLPTIPHLTLRFAALSNNASLLLANDSHQQSLLFDHLPDASKRFRTENPHIEPDSPDDIIALLPTLIQHGRVQQQQVIEHNDSTMQLRFQRELSALLPCQFTFHLQSVCHSSPIARQLLSLHLLSMDEMRLHYRERCQQLARRVDECEKRLDDYRIGTGANVVDVDSKLEEEEAQPDMALDAARASKRVGERKRREMEEARLKMEEERRKAAEIQRGAAVAAADQKRRALSTTTTTMRPTMRKRRRGLL